LRGTKLIVLGVIVGTAAVNGSATAAVGLVAAPPHTSGRAHVASFPSLGPGLAIDPNTRLPGLVAATTPLSELRVRRDPHALADVRALQGKLDRARSARASANVVVGIVLGLLALFAVLTHSPLLARAAALYAPAAIGLGLAWRSWSAIGFGALAVALVAAVPRRAFRPLLVAVLLGALLVLWHWPVTNALATIGPHPDGGGRFYGVTNQVETLLLVPALLPAALLDRRCLAPVALLAVLVVGAAATGADGAGGIVLVAGFLTLGVRIAGLRLTVPRLAAIAVGAVAAAVGFVGLDAALGGSSHVTRAVRGGPVHLVGLFLHRLHVSAAGVVASVGAGTLFAVGLAVLVVLATRRPRPAPLDALLVALGVSLLVNDTPTDVVFYGAFAGLALWIWARIGDVEAGLRPAGEPGGPS
jgi:hypothetical protein